MGEVEGEGMAEGVEVELRSAGAWGVREGMGGRRGNGEIPREVGE